MQALASAGVEFGEFNHHQSTLLFQRAQTPEPPHFLRERFRRLGISFDEERAGNVAKATFVSKEIAGDLMGCVTSGNFGRESPFTNGLINWPIAVLSWDTRSQWVARAPQPSF